MKHLTCCWRCFLSWRQVRCWGHFFLGKRGFTVMTLCGHSGPSVSDARANRHPLGAWSSRFSCDLETHSAQLKKHVRSWQRVSGSHGHAESVFGGKEAQCLLKEAASLPGGWGSLPPASAFRGACPCCTGSIRSWPPKGVRRECPPSSAVRRSQVRPRAALTA